MTRTDKMKASAQAQFLDYATIVSSETTTKTDNPNKFTAAN